MNTNTKSPTIVRVFGAACVSASVLFPMSVGAAEIIKQLDASGRVVYADRAIKGNIVIGTIESAPPPSATAAQDPATKGLATPIRPPRMELHSLANDPTRPRSIDSAYSELSAAQLTRDEAHNALLDAIKPRAGEAITHSNGHLRLLPAYFDRVAKYERASMLANERLERAQHALRYISSPNTGPSTP
jgi:Domain of unknown function (DUF4124)